MARKRTGTLIIAALAPLIVASCGGDDTKNGGFGCQSPCPPGTENVGGDFCNCQPIPADAAVDAREGAR